jgi:hypothetical protein
LHSLAHRCVGYSHTRGRGLTSRNTHHAEGLPNNQTRARGWVSVSALGARVTIRLLVKSNHLDGHRPKGKVQREDQGMTTR